MLAYKSSFNSLSIRIRFLPLGLLPSILTSITSFNKPLLRKMCRIHLFLVLVILFNSSLFSSTIINTSSFVSHSTQLTFSILLQIHISNASILLISSVFNDHVSYPCKRTLQATVLIIFLFTFRPIPLVSSSFGLLKAVLAIAILPLISLLQLPLSVINDPK